MSQLRKYINKPVHIAPLVLFRIIFGGMMLASVIRFLAKGWIRPLYLEPSFFFTYYGFGWVKPFGETGMYLIFAFMAVSAGFIMLGLWYRLSAVSFFLLFTYVELIDATTYLNHYYFVSIVSLLMVLVPANRYFSLDGYLNPGLRCTHVPAWTINIFKLQLGIVYFFAGIAKLHPEWLLEAQPLRLWLPARADMAVIGPYLTKTWVAYFFSWSGALYDLSIPFLLLLRKTRLPAYGAVVIFHILTALLFPIGMFPYIMILCTLIFFSESFHRKVITILKTFFSKAGHFSAQPEINNSEILFKSRASAVILPLLYLHFLIQLVLPFRFAAWPGNLFWTEQGFRFSWRVMLMEKAGHITFFVMNPENGRKTEIRNSDYLTPLQEKMMATQPDMILQFAHFLKEEYQNKGIPSPVVTADSYVSLNGSGSKRYIDPETDLAKLSDSFAHKSWLLPLEPLRLQARK